MLLHDDEDDNGHNHHHCDLDMSLDLLQSQLEINIRAPILCAQRASQLMKHTGGSIINISSVGGIRAHQRGVPYGVTKGAIDSLTHVLAIDLAEYHIRVNAVAPGISTQNGHTSLNYLTRMQSLNLLVEIHCKLSGHPSIMVRLLLTSPLMTQDTSLDKSCTWMVG